LTAIGTVFVHISFTGANKPAVLTGQSEANGSPITNYKYLLMPMRYSA
jgi:DNA polymerase-3 subunit beta